MSDSALAAAIRPQSYASSTTGVKKSVVDRIAVSPSSRTAAASSPVSSPTSSSTSAGPVPSRPRTMSSSSPGGILQAQPPPCAYWLSRNVVVMPPSLRRYSLYSEAYAFLVDAAVFKTDVIRYPGQAGSIPVRLRHLSPRTAVMHVLATAGHVDHGKSTLVRALTGIEPDRLAEERRRGMTLDLGFAWTTLRGGATVACVDVPGHERFSGTMLAGVGPVPGVVVVVAADEGWRAQTSEHVEVLDSLGVRHGLLVVTRADPADPGPALAYARERLSRTSLGTVE